MPVVVAMRELIVNGAIGKVKAVWCRHFVGHGGDFYFKDWHADRRLTTGLLLQKGAHDIDVIHWLAGGYTRRVNAMGGLTVYGGIDDDDEDEGGSLEHSGRHAYGRDHDAPPVGTGPTAPSPSRPMPSNAAAGGQANRAESTPGGSR
ncbi:Gfo/Idh/MocA family oxidoreductase [Streptomyces sp. NPDC057582]|uniref:Gfo/Idh/MocA family protein n=1 Tax=Streptomyces sp. NPDC057582 TaxID=3346174 RepID=UPI0036B8C619